MNNVEQPETKRERTADYLAPGDVIMDKFYYDNPEKIRDFLDLYIESIKKEGIEPDPEKFARKMIDAFLNDYEHSIKVWREILAERGNK